MTTSAEARTACLHDDAASSSMALCCSTATEQEKTVAALRAERPASWHRPVEKLLVENPNDQGFWPLVRHADLVEVTERHEDFLSGEGIVVEWTVMELTPQELLDAALGFIAMDPPRDTQIRRLQSSAFTPKQISRINDQISATAERIVDDIAHKGEIDLVHEVAYEAQLAKLQELM